MARAKRLRRAEKERQKLRAKRERRSERRLQKSRFKMSVVSSGITADVDDALSMANEVKHCHAALLYADEVSLISPKAAVLKSAADVQSLSALDFVRIITTLGARFRPDSAEAMRVV